MPGRLLIVGTPIGNLGDLSPRAAEALRGADLVVAEDTRRAARLLAHLGTRRRTRSFNEHNAAARLPELLDRLARGETLALTTDAGMPGVSDPGASLVAAARQAGARVEVVPGPSAVTAAMATAGVEAPGFIFGGFPPSRPAGRRAAALGRLLDASRDLSVPLVVFEAPHRLRTLLGEIARLAPSTTVTLCRELTKLHEEVRRGTGEELLAGLETPRGEFVLVIGPAKAASEDRPRPDSADLERIAEAGRRAGIGTRSIVELLRALGVDRRAAYRLAHRASE